MCFPPSTTRLKRAPCALLRTQAHTSACPLRTPHFMPCCHTRAQLTCAAQGHTLLRSHAPHDRCDTPQHAAAVLRAHRSARKCLHTRQPHDAFLCRAVARARSWRVQHKATPFRASVRHTIDATRHRARPPCYARSAAQQNACACAKMPARGRCAIRALQRKKMPARAPIARRIFMPRCRTHAQLACAAQGHALPRERAPHN